MGILFAIIFGGITGWVASLIMKTDDQMGVIINIFIGVLGAFFGSWLFGTVLGFDSAFTSGAINFVGFFWAILGAVILIGILKMFKLLR